MRKFHDALIASTIVVASTACAVEEHSSEGTREPLPSATGHIRQLHRAKSTGTSIELDARDSTQRAFIESRLRHAGKTPENSPNLFARLQRHRTSYHDSGLGPTPLSCMNPLMVGQDPEDPDRWVARVTTSCFSGAEYTYLDLFWWDSATGTIIDYIFTEDFESPTDLVLEYPARATVLGPNIQVDSFAVSSRGLEDHYGFDQVIQERPAAAVSDSIFLPRESSGDDVITSCIERDDGDCDYYYATPSGHIQLPLNMSFRFPRPVTQVISARAQVHMTDSGGICQSADLTAHTAVVPMSTTVVLDSKGPVDFGFQCVGDRTNVRLWVKIMGRTNGGQTYSVFWANDLEGHPAQFRLQFKWSCLAEGSKITMADGSEKRIEEVELGERVRSGRPGEWLSVVDISTGYESAPIVDLETEHGDALLVTQGHPLFDAAGRPMRADELSVGSLIQTHRGPAKVAKLERKPYAGKVYNLKLGTEHQIAGQNVGAIHMFANGLRVGDSRSQWALSLARTQEAKQAPLPRQWRRDHLMHQVRRVLGP